MQLRSRAKDLRTELVGYASAQSSVTRCSEDTIPNNPKLSRRRRASRARSTKAITSPHSEHGAAFAGLDFHEL
ncbi:hypothetical protein EVAR_3667_1 [Eumeta japonica]|uniref:Uncharacterized protein n=1 Tax=Eumeta variegata TaxID=151549 RepID=A0A4C1SRD0_EUMVA|nr:hypothetical protein EVAR_3667_1 [Eumeta japonica]